MTTSASLITALAEIGVIQDNLFYCITFTKNAATSFQLEFGTVNIADCAKGGCQIHNLEKLEQQVTNNWIELITGDKLQQEMLSCNDDTTENNNATLVT